MIEYLIKRVKEKEVVKGGIIIPDTAKEKPQEGKVIAVGHGRKTEDGKVEAIYWLAMGPSQIFCHLIEKPGARMGGNCVRKKW